MPHPMRARAAGRPVYSIPVVVFMDDMSGNVSKQWNKHISVYISNAALPRERLDKEYHTHFVTTSNHAEPMEIMTGVIDSMQYVYQCYYC